MDTYFSHGYWTNYCWFFCPMWFQEERTRQAGVQQQFLSKSAAQNEMQRYYDSLYSNMNQVNLKQCWSAYRQRGRKMKSSDFDDFKKDTKANSSTWSPRQPPICWTSS